MNRYLLIPFFFGFLVLLPVHLQGQPQFTEIKDIHIPVTMNGKLVWADFDNDSLFDVFITGVSGSDTLMAIYKNNGNNSFSEIAAFETGKLYINATQIIDLDKDGYLDIFAFRVEDDSTHGILYHNNGNSTFSEDYSQWFPDIKLDAAAFGDYNNDGFQDLVLAGGDGNELSGTAKLKLYCNDRNNGYIPDRSYFNDYNCAYHNNCDRGITGVKQGNLLWGDCNNDGYLDLMVSGSYYTSYKWEGNVLLVYASCNIFE